MVQHASFSSVKFLFFSNPKPQSSWKTFVSCQSRWGTLVPGHSYIGHRLTDGEFLLQFCYIVSPLGQVYKWGVVSSAELCQYHIRYARMFDTVLKGVKWKVSPDQFYLNCKIIHSCPHFSKIIHLDHFTTLLTKLINAWYVATRCKIVC